MIPCLLLSLIFVIVPSLVALGVKLGCSLFFLFLEVGCIATDLEKAMATHSSTLAWKTPRMEQPGGLQSMGSLRVGHD